MRARQLAGSMMPLVKSLSGNTLPCLLATVILAPGSSRGSEPSVARAWNEELLAAIRLEVPDPPMHARNLFHMAVAMYDAWAAFDDTAIGYLHREKITPQTPDLAASRDEAISHAAYRLLHARLQGGHGAETTLPRLNALMTGLGYSPVLACAPATAEPVPAELGKRIADTILAWSTGDRFDLMGHPQPYNTSLNPNLAYPMEVLGTNLGFQIGVPLGSGIPAETDPNFWQPLFFSISITQNGLPQPAGAQPFLGVQSLATVPFALSRKDPTLPWLDPFGGPSRLATDAEPFPSSEVYQAQALSVIRVQAMLADNSLIDISPGSTGNNSLGTDTGQGYPLNPVTGTAYAENRVPTSDFGRVLAEYWADGPNSETPPGHWHTLANQVSDAPQLEKRIGGSGLPVDDLEWDVKLYFALGAACHDAACAAWSLKRHYSSPRPITMIRYMAAKGQSSNPDAPSWHPQGIPLEEGLVELVTAETAAPGGRHEQIWDMGRGSYRSGELYLDQVVILGWPGEHLLNPSPPATATHQSTVRWMRGIDWVPFQRKTFNNPAFPGYVSGHSTFSRAAAEVLAAFTGSQFFPGGLHEHTFSANTMQIDLGPSVPVTLQWCAYSDAADQAGQSRIWGGIHIGEDDLHGRVVGAEAGQRAYALASSLWNGTFEYRSPSPVLEMAGDGSVRISWSADRGMAYRIQRSDNLKDWENLTDYLRSYDGAEAFDDSDPPPLRAYYRIIRSAFPLPE